MISVILLTIFVWRVSTKPLDIGFAKSYIQAALHDQETGNSMRMERVVLYWPELRGPLFLQLHGGQLVNKNEATIISVDKASISFSRGGLLSGRILPKAIILEKPTLQLVRNEQGEFNLDLGQDAPENGTQEQFDLTTRIFGYIARPGRESAKKSIISRLESFSIKDARFFIDDKIAHQSWSLPDFNVGFQSTVLGMKGYANSTLPDVGLETSKMQIEMNYLWDQKNVELSADFQNVDVRSIAGKVPALDVLGQQNIILDAHVETILDEGFIPSDVRLNITSKGGDVFHPDWSDDPIPYSELSLHASYNYDGKALVLNDTQITVEDVTVFAKADITHSDKLVSGPVKIWLDDLKQSQIKPLWPKVLRGDNSEKWVVQRSSKGTLNDVWLAFDLFAEKLLPEKDIDLYGPAEEPSWNISTKNLEAEFAFKNMDIDYRAPLDAARNVYGSGRFDLEKDELTIDITKGKIGTMKVSGAKLLFDQVDAVGKGGADIRLSMHGGVQDVMRYVSKEPINLGDDIGMDIAKVKGDADLDISLKFPTQSDVRVEDFRVGVEGTLRDVMLPDVISTLDLSGGPLKFSVKDGLASMSGVAMLESRPVDFAWEEFLNSKGKPYKEKVSAKITADPNIRDILGIDLNDFIEGSLPVDVSYVSYRDGTAKADIDVDVTNALFFVDPFDFEKQPGKEASAKFSAQFLNGDLKKITNLQASGKQFSLNKSDLIFKIKGNVTELSSGKISNFNLDKTEGALEFVFDDSGAVNIAMQAKSLDIQPFMDVEEGKGEYQEPPMVISVNAQKLLTAPNEFMRDAELFFDIDAQGRFNQMEMDAKVGKGGLYVRFNPDKNGDRSFRLKADDAGAFLKSFQVYSDIRGGKMMIYGKPVKGVLDRNLRGKAEISDFKVVNAPILTNMLSILSLTGIGEVLAGDGLAFDKLESDFNWLYRKGGSLLVLKDGRTSGNSLGLLFDGTFDNQKREVDVSGTVVPMSAVNEVIGAIPLIGDILTGGSGGVFAATYSIKGPSDKPVISVNPLSILTPGILRRILWE
ncbi:MAG: AsmA-like C-terminal domain-containing protein [Alphaproteobacteria bacterium]